MRAATLIYNPVAGRHPERREKQIRRAAVELRQAGIDARIAQTSGPGAAREIARDAARQDGTLILVCGGDGTINEVVNGLAPGPATLGILPGGTANIIAKELGLSHDPVRAARELPGWQPRRIPLGLATWAAGPEGPVNLTGPTGLNGSSGAPREQRYFLSVAGVGFDAHVVYKLSTDFKMSWGVIAYSVQAIREALRHSFPVIVCGMEGRESRGTFVVIQRTRRYAGWLDLVPGARFFDPTFNVCVFRSRNRFRYFLYAAAVFARQHVKLGDVELARARHVDCRAAQTGARVRFELDGELAGELPARFDLVPEALTLLVPPKWIT
ncbi:MAG TPA: diacylglycerol kinase family protein [Terriglobia bacterium]|nr:diacylglycerol kinase family protein [Terriglobia bacterium]